MPSYAVIIAAAGQGTRFGSDDNKVLAKLDGRPLFIRAIEAFVNRDDVCQILLSVSNQDMALVKEKFGANLGFMGVQLIEGGAARHDTVQLALPHVQEEAEFVAVHDAVRVCVSQDMIDRVFAEAVKSGAAILASPIHGTIKRVSEAGVVDGTVSRDGLFEAQTPQVFKRDVLAAAYDSMADDAQPTDDADVVASAGHPVSVVESDISNIKITVPQDLALAKAIIQSRPKPKAKKRGPFEEAQW